MEDTQGVLIDNFFLDDRLQSCVNWSGKLLVSCHVQSEFFEVAESTCSILGRQTSWCFVFVSCLNLDSNTEQVLQLLDGFLSVACGLSRVVDVKRKAQDSCLTRTNAIMVSKVALKVGLQRRSSLLEAFCIPQLSSCPFVWQSAKDKIQELLPHRPAPTQLELHFLQPDHPGSWKVKHVHDKSRFGHELRSTSTSTRLPLYLSYCLGFCPTKHFKVGKTCKFQVTKNRGNQ